MNKRAIAAAIVVLLVVVVGVTGFYLTRGDDSGINVTDLSPGMQKSAIEEGKIDGGVLWDPYASDAIVSGVADAVVWSGDFWKDHPCCIIAVDNTFAENNPDAVVAFLAAQIQALAWIQNALEDHTSEDYQILLDIVYKHSNVSEEVMLESINHMDFKIDMDHNVTDGELGFDEWLEYYTNQFITLDVIPEAKLANAGYDSVEEFIDDLGDDTYLERAKETGVSFALENEVTMRVGQLNGDLHQLALVVSLSKEAGNGSESFLEMMNINAVTTTPYNAGGNIMTAFSAGELDIAYVGSPPAIQFSLNVDNVDVSIIACANVNGSALIVKKGMFEEGATVEEIVQGLAGKTIAEPSNASIQHLFLLSIAEKYGVEISN